MDEICNCAKGLVSAGETLLIAVAFQALMTMTAFGVLTLVG